MNDMLRVTVEFKCAEDALAFETFVREWGWVATRVDLFLPDPVDLVEARVVED